MSPTPTQSDDLAKIGFEPDDVPVGSLYKMAIALTLSIVLSVVGTYFYFNYVVAQELAEKGYTTTDFVPESEYKR